MILILNIKYNIYKMFNKIRGFANNNANLIKIISPILGGTLTIGWISIKQYNEMCIIEKDIEIIKNNHLSHIEKDINLLKNNYNNINIRIDNVNTRIDKLNNNVNIRFDNINTRFDNINTRIDKLNNNFNKLIEEIQKN